MPQITFKINFVQALIVSNNFIKVSHVKSLACVNFAVRDWWWKTRSRPAVYATRPNSYIYDWAFIKWKTTERLYILMTSGPPRANLRLHAWNNEHRRLLLIMRCGVRGAHRERPSHHCKLTASTTFPLPVTRRLCALFSHSGHGRAFKLFAAHVYMHSQFPALWAAQRDRSTGRLV